MTVKAVLSKVLSKVLVIAALCPVVKIKSSFLNIEELQNSKYGVEISSEPVRLNQETNENTLNIASKYGQQYQCVLPVLHVKGEEYHSYNIAKDEINDLLEPFNSTCLYLFNGWWTYKVCFGKSVYQYHEEGNEVKDNISLGHYSGDTDWSQVTIEEKSRSNGRYHSQFYSNGTICDLTGDLRKTEVRFFCEPEGADYIARIDESSACVYIITVKTNKLCNHSAFRPATSHRKHSITCSPALMEDQFEKYTETKAKKVKDVSNGDFSTVDSRSKESEDVEEKRKKRTPSIFEALAKLFQKGLKEEDRDVANDGGNKAEDDGKIDWKDVFKTSRSSIDKSVERIRKLQLHKKLERRTDEVTSKMRTQSVKEGDATPKDYLYQAEKEVTKGEESEYYQRLIEDLKIQYQYFKQQMEIITNDLHKKIERLENGAAKENPIVTQLVERIRETMQRFEENQRTVDNEMKRLTNLNDVLMQDPSYSSAKEEIAGIRSRLNKLMQKLTSRSSSLNDDEKKDENENESMKSIAEDTEKDFETGNDIKDSKKKNQQFGMESPKLDKVVSKLKRMMTREVDENVGSEGETKDNMFEDDDRISVRVTKIKEKEQDLFDESDDESLYANDEEKELEEINGNEEMKAATKKMENIVRKQLQEAGINNEGKVKVKIITSKEALKRVAGGRTGFQILTPHETNEFKDLLSNLLGGNQEFMKEKERQEKMEENYNLVWSQDGFESAKKEYSTTDNENSDEGR